MMPSMAWQRCGGGEILDVCGKLSLKMFFWIVEPLSLVFDPSHAFLLKFFFLKVSFDGVFFFRSCGMKTMEVVQNDVIFFQTLLE